MINEWISYANEKVHHLSQPLFSLMLTKHSKHHMVEEGIGTIQP